MPATGQNPDDKRAGPGFAARLPLSGIRPGVHGVPSEGHSELPEKLKKGEAVFPAVGKSYGLNGTRTGAGQVPGEQSDFRGNKRPSITR